MYIYTYIHAPKYRIYAHAHKHGSYAVRGKDGQKINLFQKGEDENQYNIAGIRTEEDIFLVLRLDYVVS